MAYTDFALTREKPPCTQCTHCQGGCKIRSSCLRWADWERRKAARYATMHQARTVQVEEFAISRGMFRKALAKKAIGR